MLVIDGSAGEGGGQILRTSLALSLVTGSGFRIEAIRAGRRKPGLLRQHLTAVQAAAEISGARVEGADMGSLSLTFSPRAVVPGEYAFSIGTAGSATLVLQTVLPALLTASKPSRIALEGGTHNPAAPPFEFLERAFFPFINRMGPTVRGTLLRHGFYPAGGGSLSVTIEPAPRLQGLEIHERGEITSRGATAIVAHLPEPIARRELEVVARKLSWKEEWLRTKVASDSHGPGNVLLLEIGSEASHEVISAFGARGVSAEAVAESAIDEAKRYLASEAPVGVHLADQILLPLSIAGEGSYLTQTPSRHLRTNAEVIQKFLDRRIRMEPIGGDTWKVTVDGAGVA
jgi:RNA 3'-terminal phosphate cyclase (ATP)